MERQVRHGDRVDLSTELLAFLCLPLWVRGIHTEFGFERVPARRHRMCKGQATLRRERCG